MGYYLLQIILFQLLFLAVYEALLKKETFFIYNRIYLLLSPVLSFILPLLKFKILSEAVPETTRIMLPEILIHQQQSNVISLPAIYITAPEGVSINWWLIIYGAGILVSLGLFLNKYRSLNRLFRFRKIKKEKGFSIIEVPNSNLACTFFNTVFLGDQLSEEERKQILTHELIHVKQKHSADLLFFELLKIVFWFNPVIYLYQSRIAGLHEFLADEEVVKITEKRTYYEQLLNTAFNTRNISFINQFFSHSLIHLTVFGKTFSIGNPGGQVKKRIVMLQKSKSKSIAKFKYLLMLPLLLVMLTYVACTEDSEKGEKDNLEQYSYTLDNPSSASENPKIAKYEEFLRTHKDYVAWATINYVTNEVSYTVHPKKEAVPEGYQKMEVQSDNGEYIMYMNLKSGGIKNNSANPVVTIKEYDTDNNNADVPFAVIDEVPVFPGCENLSTNKERKECMSSKITDFVSTNFNTGKVKAYSQPGINRVIVQFKIDKNGNVTDVKARASAPELANEAKSVLNSLPQMKPGKQKGQPVNVVYSLPIVFQYAE